MLRKAHKKNSNEFLTSGHERCPGDVGLEVERLANDLEDGDEVVVADGAEGDHEVDGDNDVDGDAALRALILAEKVPGKLLDGRRSAVPLAR